jgi:hypothetical protein
LKKIEINEAASLEFENLVESNPSKRHTILLNYFPLSYSCITSSDNSSCFFLHRDGLIQLLSIKVSWLLANLAIFGLINNSSISTEKTGDKIRLQAL